MTDIVLSYRSADSGVVALQIADALVAQFGAVTVGVDGLIEPGDDYLEAIETGIQRCQAVVVVIGGNWLDDDWAHDADDYDTIALSAAINHSKVIVPVLVNGGAMPDASRLPETLSKLSRRAGLAISGAQFDQGIERLIAALSKTVQPSPRDVMVYQQPAQQVGVYAPPITQRQPYLIEGTNRWALPGIDATAFQHPLDRVATESLRKLKGFDLLVSKFIEFGYERYLYFINVANNVKVGPDQFPTLHRILLSVCETLDVPEPDMYVQQTPLMNAFTFGHTKPYIVLYTGLLDSLNDDEIMAVIAHEVGHIKCGHVLYHTMAVQLSMVLTILSAAIPVIGSLLSTGVRLTLELGFYNWKRRSELSADRAALLVMQDARPCVTMLAKFAGGTRQFASELNPVDFLEQARLYNEITESAHIDRFYRFLAALSQSTHPFAIERAKYLNEWIDSPEFDQILQGNYPRTLQVRGGNCPNCGAPVQPQFKFCATCGRPTV